MKIAIVTALPALLIVGSAAAQTQRPVAYQAVGTEPGWTLTIDKGTIRYLGDYGSTKVLVDAPVPRPAFNGRRYETPRISIDITRSRCSDGMSEREFPDTVIVTVGRQTVRGCGGEPIIAPASSPILAGRWRIENVGGLPVRGQRPATLSFNGDRISGHSGCNGFGGGYRFERGFLTIGQIASTRMACAGPVMAQERAILATLGQRMSVSTSQTGKLVLSGRGSARLVLTRDLASKR